MGGQFLESIKHLLQSRFEQQLMLPNKRQLAFLNHEHELRI